MTTKRMALVVDDAKAIRLVLRDMLVDLGFDVVEAQDGRSALAQLQEHPDVLLALADWNMPGMDGLAFVRAVRGRPELRDVRLVMCSCESELSQVVRALEAGANEYVMKPFTRAVLESKIALLELGES